MERLLAIVPKIRSSLGEDQWLVHLSKVFHTYTCTFQIGQLLTLGK